MQELPKTNKNKTENELKELARRLHAQHGGRQLGFLSHSGTCWFDILLEEMATAGCDEVDAQRLRELAVEKMESEDWKLLMTLLELGKRLQAMTLEERTSALAFFSRKS
jgi:hypothetical protein